MSNNIPILLIGGAALAVGVYFLTKKKDPIVVARERRQRDVARGGPALVSVNMEDDPPLKGARVADSCSIERRGDWSREDPKFILSCDGAVFTRFDHKRRFQPPEDHPTYGKDRCGRRCTLYQPGPNPNAKYPSEFVETSKGIAAILGTVGKGVTGAFQAKSQFDVQKAQLKAGRGGGGDQTAAIIAALSRKPKKSNTGLIIAIVVGGLALAGMMFFMMNQGE